MEATTQDLAEDFRKFINYNVRSLGLHQRELLCLSKVCGIVFQEKRKRESGVGDEKKLG